MKGRVFLFVILAVGVYLLNGCVPSATNRCIDIYYEVLEQTEDRDDAAQAYWECAEGRNNE